VWDLWWTKWHWDRVFPCQFHSTCAPLLGKGQKIIIIIVIFITGSHKKPHGYSASVASAAGPFTTKKIHIKHMPTCGEQKLEFLMLNIVIQKVRSFFLKDSLKYQRISYIPTSRWLEINSLIDFLVTDLAI
jgi:hypothetical protein